MSKNQFSRGQFHPGVSLAERNARFRLLSSIHYKLSLNFVPVARKGFSGRVQINFCLRNTSSKRILQNIFLDFRSGSIKKMSLNGTPLRSPKHYEHKGERILFSPSLFTKLSDSKCVIDISYTMPFANDSSSHGMIRLEDPLDKEVYIYTVYNPFCTSGIFPCFDQPNLPARYSCSVEVPGRWEAICNTALVRRKKMGPNYICSFKDTVPFPTHMFLLFLGPFDTWTGPTPDGGRRPLKLYSCKSNKYRHPHTGFAFVVDTNDINY
jgi:aminopeptidase N